MGKKLDDVNKPLTEITVRALLWDRRYMLALCLLITFTNRGAGLVLPYLSKNLIDEVITRPARSNLAAIVGVIILATLVQAVSAYLLTQTVSLSVERLVANLRKRIYRHVSRLPLTYYDSIKTGALVNQVLHDVEGIRSLIGGGMVEFLGAIITSALAFVILIRIHVGMTLTIFSILLIFGILLRNRLRVYRPFFKEFNVLMSELTGRLAESFSGVRVVKAYHAELQEQAVFDGGIDRLLRKRLITIRASSLLSLSITALTGITGAAVMYLGGCAIIEGTITIGDFFRYTLFLGILTAPLVNGVSLGTRFNEAVVGIERVAELLSEPREDQDSARVLRVGPLSGEVRFEAVSFAYGDDAPILSNVSFRAEPGTVTALVGPSGAGKSTIIGLIAGFYEASKGTILVDGIDISRVDLDSYRRQLAIVPQDAFLFSGTIRENVAFGRPHATEGEIIDACRIAHVDEFAHKLKDGYETIVGERGIKLSLGQRQRVAIARAILANPRILILDEATSNLDSVSEAVIQEALSFLLCDRTTFVIAHRLSTIHRADQILVINGGRIVERGTHESLFRAKNKYWELYTTQYDLNIGEMLPISAGDRPN